MEDRSRNEGRVLADCQLRLSGAASRAVFSLVHAISLSVVYSVAYPCGDVVG